jgi:flagellar hook-basal body complex protein FliE
MKTIALILALGLIVAAAIGGFFYGRLMPAQSPQHLTLEQILSIRELHLVKHTYTDLFFLHKNNNPAKAIRAMVQMPVTITAYLNLKDIELVWQQDSLQSIILPRAQLNEPVYHTNRMVIRETRSVQVHVGKDLYPQVGEYLGKTISAQMDTVRQLAESNRILIQAEAEGKEYIESILKALGQQQVVITFNDAVRDQLVAAYQASLKEQPILAPPRTRASMQQASIIPFGFLPLE